MTDLPRIDMHRVSKRYVKYDDAPLLVTRALRLRTRTKQSKLWALRDIDLSVAPGECIGVIGRNGSGKSTMLRLLAGVSAPTTGRVAVRGRIAPLISVGVGFHQELTGRENVYVNGMILGLTRAEMDDRFDEIVDFAEIGDFIDTPVKFYSSGMFVRLGFAVSVLAEPDVLLVDEVLAVGDVAFQMKCLTRMSRIREAGTTIVLVSHNLGAIRNMCDRTVVLHQGLTQHNGDTGEAISLLHELLGDDNATAVASGQADDGTRIDPAATVESTVLLDPEGRPTANIDVDAPVAIVTETHFFRAADVLLGVAVFNEVGIQVYGDSGPWGSPHHFDQGERAAIRVTLDPRLAPGTYSAQIGIVAPDGTVLTRSIPTVTFYVGGRERTRGIADLRAEFSVERPVTPES